MATTYVMKVSSNGQVSIPAETRARWLADQVVVVDLGDRVVLRPLPTIQWRRCAGSTGRGPPHRPQRERRHVPTTSDIERRRR